MTASINVPLGHHHTAIVLSFLEKLNKMAADQMLHRDKPRPPKLPPVPCAPWCEDGDGHPNCFGASDQACWSDSEYVGLSLAPDDGEGPPRIGVMARREPATKGAVRLHLDGIMITGPIPSPWDYLDESLDLTPDEAEQLAAALIANAKLVRRETPPPPP